MKIVVKTILKRLKNFFFNNHFKFERKFFIYRVFQQIDQIRSYFEKFVHKSSIKIDKFYERLHISMRTKHKSILHD